MLKTLFKHEMKATGKTMCPIYGVFAAATLLVCILGFWMNHGGGSISGWMFTVSFIFYVITLVVLMTGSLIYLCWRFYYTMYSSQGYLTHTLPVKTSSVLNCKVAVSAGYFIMTCVACVLSIACAGMAGTGEGVGMILDVIKLTVAEGAGAMGLNQAVFAIFMLAVFVLSSLSYLLMFFAGSSIGQLAKRSKGAAGIGAGIGLYYASQIVTVILVGVGYLIFGQMEGMVRIAPLLVILLQFTWVTVYYLISRIILVRHLNLA